MKLRVAIVVVLAVATAVPTGPASAQSSSPPKRLGWLASTNCAGSTSFAAVGKAFIDRLAELGWIEGRTLIIDCVSAGNRLEQFAPAATELVGRRPDALVGFTT